MIMKLDYNSDIPIYVQLRNQIVIGIGVGGLEYGEKLQQTSSPTRIGGFS